MAVRCVDNKRNEINLAASVDRDTLNNSGYKYVMRELTIKEEKQKENSNKTFVTSI